MAVPLSLGLSAGLIAALVLARTVEGFLFGVGPRDPATFAGLAVLLCLVALAGTLIPTRRAARIDPMEALRYE